MNQQKAPQDPATGAPPLQNEADIGSGERSPGQQETDRIIREVPPTPPGKPGDPVLP